MDKIQKALDLLQDIMNDRGVPRNVKSSLEKSIDSMKSDKEESESVKISTVISILDDASNDPNISLQARTKIWDVVSKLEELSK